MILNEGKRIPYTVTRFSLHKIWRWIWPVNLAYMWGQSWDEKAELGWDLREQKPFGSLLPIPLDARLGDVVRGKLSHPQGHSPRCK